MNWLKFWNESKFAIIVLLFATLSIVDRHWPSSHYVPPAPAGCLGPFERQFEVSRGMITDGERVLAYGVPAGRYCVTFSGKR